MTAPYKFHVETETSRNRQKCQFTYPSKVEKNERKSWRRLAPVMEGLSSQSWNTYFRYGFEVVGPLLFGYCRWLHKAAAEQGVEHLFFLSRDGYLLINAYKELYPNGAAPSSYLYVSRKVVRQAQFWLKSDLCEVSNLFPENAFLKCDEFLRYFNIESAGTIRAWKDCGLSTKMCFLPKDLLKDRRLTNFYEKIKPQIIEESKKSYEKIIRYLHQNQFSGKVGIVDIGWAGTIQTCLETILSNDTTTEIIGFYLGLTQEAAKMKNRFSFIADSEKPQEFDAGFVEYPFLAPEGSLLNYVVDSDGFIIPELANFEYDQTEHDIVKSMQAGALHFVQCARDFPSEEFTWDAEFSYANLKRLSKHPTFREVKSFGDLTFYDGGKRQIAAPRSLAYYLLHPRDFPYDLSVSGWRIGFLKRLLKLGLNYDKLLRIYKNVRQA